MTPKFIEVTRRVCGKPAGVVMVNPRRIDTFCPENHAKPNDYAVINFGRGEYLCVMETVQQIITKLNK